MKMFIGLIILNVIIIASGISLAMPLAETPVPLATFNSIKRIWFAKDIVGSHPASLQMGKIINPKNSDRMRPLVTIESMGPNGSISIPANYEFAVSRIDLKYLPDGRFIISILETEVSFVSPIRITLTFTAAENMPSKHAVEAAQEAAGDYIRFWDKAPKTTGGLVGFCRGIIGGIKGALGKR